jgi:hypothetical protein
MKASLLLCCCFFSALSTAAAGGADKLNLKDRLQPVPEENIFRNPGYHTWCSSLVRGEDGKYHLFYSRWPMKYLWPAWLTHCEVAHAVADSPAGPWTFKDVAISGRGKGHWDAITTHNPKIKHFEGKYYLYYISTNWGEYDYTEKELAATAIAGNPDPRWQVLRSHQRTGVAMSDSLDGPWERMEVPLIEPSGPIETIAVNPAIAQGPDGRYYMIVKGDKPGAMRRVRNQALAIGTSPTGPFEIQLTAVIDYMDTEDMSIWYDETRERFYGIFRVTHREPRMFIGVVSSPDGIHWDREPEFVLNPKELQMANGRVVRPDRFERPFVFREDGEYRTLSMGFKLEDPFGNAFRDDSGIVFFPLRQN